MYIIMCTNKYSTKYLLKYLGENCIMNCTKHTTPTITCTMNIQRTSLKKVNPLQFVIFLNYNHMHIFINHLHKTCITFIGKHLLKFSFFILIIVLGLGCSMPLSTIFQLNRGGGN